MDGENNAEISRGALGKKLKTPELVKPHTIEPPIPHIDNEFLRPPDLTIVTPLKSVEINGKNYDQKIQANFEKLSRTRTLEVDTDRTELLQKIADKMGEKVGITTRIVIMGKTEQGEGPNAFVTPDGTIFIDQALLDEFEYLDEAAGVIAHEIGHLKFDTFGKAAKAGDKSILDYYAVGWLHESASDSLTHDLLVDAGFNSQGHAIASMRGDPNLRDIEHQTGLSRTSHSVGVHTFLDFKTSGQEWTTLPDSLKAETRKKTNFEILKQAVENKYQTHIEALLPNLHPSDLERGYIFAMEQEPSIKPWEEGYDQEIVAQQKIADVFHTVFTNRLNEAGFSDDQINLFFLQVQNQKMPQYNFSSITTPERLLEVVAAFPDFYKNKTLDTMQQALFGKEYKSESQADAGIMAQNISARMYDVEIENDPRGIPVTKESVLNLIFQINHIDSRYWHGGVGSWQLPDIERITQQYIEHRYLPNEYIEETDEEGIRTFLQEVKAKGIQISDSTINEAHESSERFQTINPVLQKLYKETFITPEVIPDVDYIGNFFDKWTNLTHESQVLVFGNFLKGFRKYLDKHDLTDGERLRHVSEFDRRITEEIHRAKPQKPLDERLRLDYSGQDTPEELGRKIILFNMRSLAALNLFQKDGPEFYEYLEKTMQESEINPEEISWQGMVNISENLFFVNNKRPYGTSDKIVGIHTEYSSEKLYLGKNVQVENVDQLLSLPFLRHIRENTPPLQARTLKDVNYYLSSMRWDLASEIHDEATEIFSDSLISLVLGEKARHEAVRLIEAGIPEAQFSELYKFIDDWFPKGQHQRDFLNKIKRRTLTSKDISLPQKIDFLVDNFDNIGIEGAVLLAEQITTMTDYRLFREKLGNRVKTYLDGGDKVQEIAAADVVSSELIGHFESLLETSKEDPLSKRKASTALAKRWLRMTFGGTSKYHESYDSDSHKVLLTDAGRKGFRTPADLFASLRAMSPTRRFAIAHKALVDKGGALTTPENRQELGAILVESLGLQEGFLAKGLQYLTEEADPAFFSLPAAKMLSPLLFRAVDVDAIDYTQVENNEEKTGIPDKDLRHLMTTSTRDITLFGQKYLQKEGSQIAQLAKESDSQYQRMDTALGSLLLNETTNANGKEIEQIDPAIEAVIKGIEASGALGVRSLQLMRQLFRFSPAIDRRLSKAFDARPGLEKLAFWENLYRYASDESRENAEIKDFIENRLITVDEILGGGSLYTTYAARVKDENGEIVDSVLKMRNPNPEMFIETTHKAATRVFERIEETGSRQDKKYARMGKIFVDLAREWCIRDIQDETFVEDDDRFRGIIDGANLATSDKLGFYAPKRLFTSERLKSERRATTQTLNQFLNENSIPAWQKREAAHGQQDFFSYQLRPDIADENDARIIHSDPHIGNYMVRQEQTGLQVGVIDRSMYLKLSTKEADMFHELLVTGNYRSFMPQLIDHVLDANTITAPGRRRSIKGDITRSLTAEYFGQHLKKMVRLQPEIDNFGLLQKLMGKFAEDNLDVPLETRLMIRNVESCRELIRRYGTHEEPTQLSNLSIAA